MPRLNHECHAEEVAAGLVTPDGKPVRAANGAGRAKDTRKGGAKAGGRARTLSAPRLFGDG